MGESVHYRTNTGLLKVRGGAELVAIGVPGQRPRHLDVNQVRDLHTYLARWLAQQESNDEQ